MKQALLLVGMMIGTLAHANEGVSKAREMCRYLGGSDTVNACLKTLKDADYLDASAVDVCRYLGGSEKVVACLKAVRDRHHEDSEIGTCRYLGGADKVITCLENTGRRQRGASVRLERAEEDDEPRVRLSIGRGASGNAGLRKTLKRALEAVRSGDTARAEALLEAAIDSAR